MEKHIMLFVMSPYNKNPKYATYTDISKKFSAECVHTNETAVRYVQWNLLNRNLALESAYAFVSDKVKKDDLPKFKEIEFEQKLNLQVVDLPNNGDLIGSFKAVSNMFDVLKEDLKGDFSNTVIHVDMTGGPRHASMLMLALLQMLLYNHAKMGYVLYSNFEKQLIEDAKDIVDMFSLMGGTQEFISYGSVEEIKDYFIDKEKSPYMQALLDSMEEFSEALKICVGYEEIEEKLSDLSAKIRLYRMYLGQKKHQTNPSEQELFFSKLLDTVEREYGDILPDEQGQCDVGNIIKWSVDRGLLQQALTFYTEWLPKYIIDRKLVQIKDKKIIEECSNTTKDWVAWENFFFRGYKPALKVNLVEGEPLNYLQLRGLLDVDDFDIKEFKGKIKGCNVKLEALCNELMTVDNIVAPEKVAGYIHNLPDDNNIKNIMQQVCPPTSTLRGFINKRIETITKKRKSTTKASTLVMQSLLQMSKDALQEIFDIVTDKTSQAELSIDELVLERQQIMDKLAASGKLVLKLRREDFNNVLASYIKSVQVWRNSSNHAAAINGGKEKSQEIADDILLTLQLLQNKSFS